MFSRRERLVLILLVGATFMLSVDFSILNVAVPAVAAGVRLGRDGLPWISAAYALPAAALMLLFGRLADLVGRRRMFCLGMALLIAGSVVGGVAGDPVTLLTGRALQGMAAAMATPAALALLTSTFDGPRRARALGFNGALASAGFSVGALAGGSLVGIFGWRAAMLVNVPVALVVLVLTPRLLAEHRPTSRPRLDVLGAMTVTLGLLLVVYGLTSDRLWLLGIGVAVLVVFTRLERRVRAPLVHLELLARRPVWVGNVAGMVTQALVPAMIFLLTLYLQQLLGLGPVSTGLVFGIPGMGSVVAGIVTGRLIGRLGGRRVLTAALATEAVALVPMVLLGTDRAWVWVLAPALLVSFFGHVSALVATAAAATGGMPADQQGLATGLIGLSQQIGPTIGVPLLTTIAFTQALPLTGLRLALSVDLGLTVALALLVAIAMRSETTGPDRTPTGNTTSTEPA